MFRRKRSADDFAEEIRAHLALESDELKDEGLADEEAFRRARIEFGSVGGAQERFRLRRRIEALDNLVRDARFTLRQLRKHPGFALTAILVLALGMGAAVAIFAFVDAALIQPLPYAYPNRLMSLNESEPGAPRWPLSYPDYLDWQRMAGSFSSIDVFTYSGYLLHTASGAEPVRGMRVSGSFFQTLGVHPFLGRDFSPGEDRIGGPNVALITYPAWLHRFGARRNVVGQSVILDDTAYTVIGVLPREFSFAPGGNTEFWVELNSLSFHEQQRTFHNCFAIGRLRNGVSLPAAQAELKAIAQSLHRQFPAPGEDSAVSITPLTEVFLGDVRPILLTLLGGAGLLLLIACVNVAGLVLVRSETRRREVAIRGALGATPARLVRQFVTEGLILAVAGSVSGLLIAAGLIGLLARFVPKGMAANMPFVEGAGLNSHTGPFAAAVVLLAGLLLAATPVLRHSLQAVRDDLAEGGRGASGRLWRRLGANLVVSELAIAVLLLTGAGLLGQSFYRLLHVSIGFDPGHLATLQIMAPGRSPDQMAALFREIEGRVRSLPGVESLGMTNLLPVQCDCAVDRIHFPGRPYHDEHNDVDERHITPGYLQTLKARLLRGRYFTEGDNASAPRVAIVSQSLARTYFPGQDPIGQKIDDDEGGHPTEWQIVGVIEDIREGPLDAPVAPAEYFPMQQTPDHSLQLAVRTSQDAGSLLPSLVNTLRGIDLNVAVSDESTMDDRIGDTQSALLHRFSAWLVGGFATMALLLGVVGLYGVIACSVSQRTREIGVRMALGARRSSVYGLVIRQAGWLTLAGIAIGMVASLGSSALISKLLFGVKAWDALTLGAVALLLALASLLASLLPARRAAAVDPSSALRAE